MAARLNPQQDERTRSAIRTTQLVKRLEAFALAEPDPQTSEPVKMDKQQVQAALGLLRKTLPDLANVQVSGDPDRPMKFEVELVDARPPSGD